MTALKRIARFTTVIGIVLIMLFLYSDSMQTPRLSFLFYGLLMLAISLLFGLIGPKSAAPPSEPKYFRVIRGKRKEQKIDRNRERKE